MPSATAIGRPARIFLSYAHVDEAWRNLLERHLKVLVALGIAEIWTDRCIGAGEAWKQKIFRAIDSSHLAILLISADFLGSTFIMNTEAPRILERHRAGELAIVPVLVRDCDWEAVPWLQEIQIRPWNAVPLSMRKGRKETEVKTIIREVRGILAPSLAPPSLPDAEE